MDELKQKENIKNDVIASTLEMQMYMYNLFLDAHKENKTIFTNATLDTSYKILENGNILIEYEYCYAGEDVILNLPMIEVGEDAFEIEKQAYKDYIDSLTKYNSKIELKENKEYEYSKYMIVSYEKI